MANVIVTIKIMPESPDVNLDQIREHAEQKIDAFVGSNKQKQHEIKPVAFGLKSLEIHFMMDEAKGSPESLADEISGFDGVQSAEITNVNRPMG